MNLDVDSLPLASLPVSPPPPLLVQLLLVLLMVSLRVLLVFVLRSRGDEEALRSLTSRLEV